MSVERGVAQQVVFPLYSSATGLLLSGVSASATVSKDGGAFNAVTDAPVEIGSSGHYELTLTAGEMTADVVVVKVTATGALTATVAIVTDTLVADVASVQSDTNDIQTRLPAALVSGRMDASVGAMSAGVVTATAIATNAIDADALAADAVTEIQSGLATAAALATVQADTDDIQTRLPAALVGGRMDASVGAMATGVVTAAAIAADAIGASELAADAVSEIAAAVAAPSAATIADAVWDEPLSGHLTAGTTGKKLDDAAAAGTPPTAIEIADAVLSRPISNVEGSAAFRTLAGAIAKLVNRVRTNGGTLTVYKTDDTTTLATQTLTRDASAEPVTEVNTD